MEFPEPQDHCTNMMSQMYNLSQGQSLCDLSIVAGNEIFEVHKCVFAAASATLKKMILRENQKQHGGMVKLSPKGVTAVGIKNLVSYVYTGKIPRKSNIRGMKAFEKACEFFGIFNKNSIISSSLFDEVELDNLKENISVAEKNDKENSIEKEDADEVQVETDVEEIQDDNVQNSNLNEDVEYVEIFSADNSEDDEPPESQLVVHILRPDDSSSDSDRSYNPVNADGTDSSDTDIDDESPIKSLNRGKENINKSEEPSKKKRKVRRSKSKNYVAGLDISSLFSVKKKSGERNSLIDTNDIDFEVEDEQFLKPKLGRNIASPFPFDPDNCLKRGRPKAANDGIFPNKPPFACPHENCDRVYDTREKCKKHYRVHDEKKHACEHCGRKFLYNKDLISHIRTHTGEKPFQCEVCDAKFAQKSTLTSHKKVHIVDVPMYYCEQCGQQYRSEKGLRNHAKLHTQEGMAIAVEKGKPHSCPICAKRYCNELGVKQHLKRSHPESEMVKQMPRLPRAKKTDEQREMELQSAVEIHEGIGETVIEFTETPDDDHHQSEYICNGPEAHYICGECGATFKTEEEGNEHQCMSDKTQAEKLDAVAAAVSSIGGVETSEACDVKILNLENMF
uniref:GDNF-inducible zinc finger protein 1-like n=1 Tax=Styela clava TaxID=7725 RepID=UPI0019394EFA|nr:GDNF-inducible zinc finger protein 1-like [Styela clava]